MEVADITAVVEDITAVVEDIITMEGIITTADTMVVGEHHLLEDYWVALRQVH